MTSSRSSNSKAAGFTILELTLALAVLITGAGLVMQVLATTLRVKHTEERRVQVQQDLRTALQLITQDLRSAAQYHVWNLETGCDDPDAACSTGDRVAVVTVDGTGTPIVEAPGASFAKAAETGVCDARGFEPGDLALVYNGENTINDADPVSLVEVTRTQLLADHDQPCRGNPTPNRDKLQHHDDQLNGTWSPAAYALRARVATYTVRADPADPARTVLYRRSGLGTAGSGSGIVAFNVTAFNVAYGVPVDPDAVTSRVAFYPNLDAAVAAAGPERYAAVPGRPGRRFIGTAVRAIRVTIAGAEPGAESAAFNVSETVDFRR